MCGISFYFSQKKSYINELKLSLNKTNHRGPDSSGELNYQASSTFIGLGHNRLSVIELSELGAQPMSLSSGVDIIFNGEIYNYKKIKKDLEALGVNFTGSSDTEVILKAYNQFGVSAFAMLQGMYGFVIVDTKTNKAYIVRDLIGIKPIYLTEKDGEVFGSSEIKGLDDFCSGKFSVDQLDVYEFFNNGFVYEPNTGLKEVKKLLPGHYLEIDLITFEKTLVEFQKLEDFENEGHEHFDKKLNEAVDKQLNSDVPLGLFYSGGLDSTVIASKTKNSDLFFAEYSSDINADLDKKYAHKIAKVLDREVKVVEMKDDGADINTLVGQIEFVAKNTEELISDYTFWPTYRLASAAKENGYTVMLSGMGGDEAFCGYPRYKIVNFHSVLSKLKMPIKLCQKFSLYPKSFDKKIDRLLSYATEKYWPLAYSRLLGYFGQDELSMLFDNEEHLKNDYSKRLKEIADKYTGDKSNKLKLAMHFDRYGFLSHNLMVSDKASMLASIELRVPLLDECVYAAGSSMGNKELMNRKYGKLPLFNIAKAILPKELVQRPKTGFNPPLDGVIDKLGRDFIDKTIHSLSPYISIEHALEISKEHFSGERNNSYKLWQITYFKYWLEGRNIPK
ncbi:asparagine synthase (glutamine-hydrolyzing) [Grimontia sp. S25]|uniref:asparagine synthase (glutamine-hydrolyzing) n=1 Tax=Grimontia sedimenti TaxID=2711294 RepID=A0A6M1R7W1_9GAMM|nr:asparagine synthase (glutamine-hydrolyzing) [Grimontia sedimenti]NGN98465.1 asparagine synthase (glutamine-hydrolyzing) [Grimontia sedimenti]